MSVDSQLAAYRRAMGMTPLEEGAATKPAATVLNEGGQPATQPVSQPGTQTPVVDPPEVDEDQEVAYATVQEAVDAIYAELQEEWDNDPVLSTEAYYESTVTKIKAKLTEMVEVAISEQNEGLEEARKSRGISKGSVRKIRRRVGGKLKQVKQKLSSRMDRLKAKIQRKQNRASIRKTQIRYAHSALGRKTARLFKAAEKATHESTNVSQLKAMLESKTVVVKGEQSDMHVALQEAYALVENIAVDLKWFFENYGTSEDAGMAEVAQKLQESATSRYMLMESGSNEPEIGALLNQVRVLQSALKVFDQYRMLQPAQLGN